MYGISSMKPPSYSVSTNSSSWLPPPQILFPPQTPRYPLRSGVGRQGTDPRDGPKECVFMDAPKQTNSGPSLLYQKENRP